MNPHRGFCSAGRHGRRGRSARTRSGRLRLAHSPLEETSTHIVPSIDHYQFNIHAVLEPGATLDLCRSSCQFPENCGTNTT